MRRLVLFALIAAAPVAPAIAREAVVAGAPEKVAITLYRDPERGLDDAMDRDDPRGFAMISETRSVTLPPGESTIRFAGVAEGMVAVTAIVTGLPGGTIEKNRNADLLSPAALVDGTLGNRVTITRTNPATGAETREQAVVRTRADGGLVLQTAQGFEAVRCAGLPERLTFDRVPAELSAQPVYSVDTRSPGGGTYTVTLTYLAWGFDWQAHYVASFAGAAYAGREAKFSLTSWLTLVNDNGQSFPDAELMAVAGRLKVESDYRGLADPPVARPLQLQCYPIGSTAAGSPVGGYYPAPPAPPPPPAMMAMAMESADAASIVVTGARISRAAMVARQEELGDLKLYRVPEPITVAAKSAKQIAFLEREGITGDLLYVAQCDPWSPRSEAAPAAILLRTVNDAKHGLGTPLPAGRMTVFAPARGDNLLVSEQPVRDFASGEDVELPMAAATQVNSTCAVKGEFDSPGGAEMEVAVSNANPAPVKLRLVLGPVAGQAISGAGRTRIKDGMATREITLPANRTTHVRWRTRATD